MRISFFEHIKTQDKVNFARHLAIMIKAGLPLFESLKIIKKQSKKGMLARIIDELVVSVSNGQSLAEGLSKYSNLFGNFFVNVVAVGEKSGTLADNLLYLSEELRKERLLKNKIRSAMIYPMILLVMAVGISAFLTFFVFPKILPLFDSMNVELPATTETLIAVLGFLRVYGLWVLIGFIALVVAFRLLLKVEPIKYIVNKMELYLPVVSKLIIHVSSANFSRMLGVLLKSGVTIVDAVNVVSNTFNNLVYRRALQDAAHQIEKGEPLARYLSAHTKIFPELLSAMIEVGENTGTLEGNLFYISDYYTEEVDTSVKNLTSFMEPLLLIVMGLLVGFIALSIITPIYSITQGIGS